MTQAIGSRGAGRRGYAAAITDERHQLDPAQARKAWNALQRAGGLVSAADLQERWGSDGQPLSKVRAHELTRLDGFPEPIEERRGRKLWLAAEVDAWKRARAEHERRGPRPRNTAQG